jgi:hypothetical protein
MTHLIINNFSKKILDDNFLVRNPMPGLIDENSDTTIHPYRKYNDECTTAFVNNIVKDKDKRYLFLDYTFNQIYSDLKTKVNMMLIESQNLPLCGNEQIYLVFKGGNIMNHYFDEYIMKSLGTNKNNKTAKELSTYFKISDVDYSIYIKNTNESRFNLIHGFVVRCLAESFEKITSFFDTYYREIISGEINLPSDKNIKTTDDDGSEIDKSIYVGMINFFKKWIGDPDNMNIVFKAMRNNEKINFGNDMTNIISMIYDEIKSILPDNNKLYDLVNYIDVINYLLFFLPFWNLQPQENIKEILKNAKNKSMKIYNSIFDDKQKNLIKIKFYTRDNIESLKKDVVGGLNALTDKIGYREFSDGLKYDVDKYQLVNGINLSDISIQERKCTIVKRKNDNVEQISILNIGEKIHYITYNNTINIRRNGNCDITHFDLMRTKLNFKLKNNKMIINNVPKDELSLGSEFIDCSIPMYDDGGLIGSTFKKNYMTFSLSNGKNKVTVIGMTEDDVIDDLNFVLYKQHNFTPWLDKKYEKRLMRSTLFMYMVSYFKNKDYNLFLDQVKKITDMIGEIRKYIKNEIKTFPFDRLKEFINDDINETNYEKYIELTKKQILSHEILDVKKEYHYFQYIVSVSVMCSLMVKHPRSNDFINFQRRIFKFIEIKDRDLGKKFAISLDTYCEKLITIFDQITIFFEDHIIKKLHLIKDSRTNNNLHRGGFRYYDDYLKNKSLWLKIKNK